MTIEAVNADRGLVLCVGMPLRHVGELAKQWRDLAVVVAAPDVGGALTLLIEDHEASDESRRSGRDRTPGAAVADSSAPAPTSAPETVMGPLRISHATREVSVADISVGVSAQEFDLLAALASDVSRVWSFEELHARVWRTGYLGDRDHVNSAIKRLRRRLGARPGVELVSVRGVGYRLIVAREPAVPTALATALRGYPASGPRSPR